MDLQPKQEGNLQIKPELGSGSKPDLQFLQEVDWTSFESLDFQFEDTSQLFHQDFESERLHKQHFPLSPPNLKINSPFAKRGRKRKSYVLEYEEDDNQLRMEKRELPQNEIEQTLIILGIDPTEREEMLQKNVIEVLNTQYHVQPILICRCADEEFWRATFEEQAAIEKLEGQSFSLVPVDRSRMIRLRFTRPVLYYHNKGLPRPTENVPTQNPIFTLHEYQPKHDEFRNISKRIPPQFPNSYNSAQLSPYSVPVFVSPIVNRPFQRPPSTFDGCSILNDPSRVTQLIPLMTGVLTCKLIEGISFHLVTINGTPPYPLWIPSQILYQHFPNLAISTPSNTLLPPQPTYTTFSPTIPTSPPVLNKPPPPFTYVNTDTTPVSRPVTYPPPISIPPTNGFSLFSNSR